MKSLASFVLRGPVQAILVTVVMGVLAIIIPPLSILSGAAVALTTLRLGNRSGAVVLLGSIGIVVVLAWITAANFSPNVIYLSVLWLFLWVMSWLLRESRSLALATVTSGLLGVLSIAATYLFLGDVTGWWEGVLPPLLEPAMQPGGPLADPELARQILEGLPKVMTGYIAAGLVLNTVLCLYLARSWQAKLFNPGGFSSEFYEMRFGVKAALLSMTVLVLVLVPMGGLTSAAAEMLIVVLSLYVIQGLAIIHAVVAKKKMHVAWLAVSYIMALFISPQLVALLGLADTWTDFRRRISSAET
jgi:hypothetical protein